MSHILEDLRLLLHKAPTAWHAVQELGNRFALHEFTPLDESLPWSLDRGGKYFVIRGGSLCAFCLPTKTTKRAVLLGAHTDSPALKLKPLPEMYRENTLFLRPEVYGGPILSSWMNRDLGIAGRIVVENYKGDLEEKLVYIDDSPLIIPHLAIHLEKDMNEKGLIINPQEHLCPLACLNGPKEGSYIEKLMRRHVSFRSLITSDLFLVPLEESRFLGDHGELLSGYRLDNLVSCHAIAKTLCSHNMASHDCMHMAIFWDHEEIGSGTAEGAGSNFLQDILNRLPMAAEDLLILKRQMRAISIDVAHALHPQYPEKHDPDHRPLLGKGIVFKTHAGYKYASTAPSMAPLISICKQFSIPHQLYAPRSDMPSGSTIGPILARSLGIPVTDIGIPQLSMHSIREIIACQDHENLCYFLERALW